MEQKIRKYIEEEHMIERGDVVIAAVSGGADSVCMLLVLHALCKQMGFALEVVHIEHGIRGKESIRDAQFVKALCEKLEILHTQYSVNVLQFSKAHHIGIEEAARLLRYEHFCKRAEEIEAPVKIALAHHMEDNAETILFQMARGSGMAGMRGIMPVRKGLKVTYIRPLLLLARQEIEEYLQQREQSYVLDSTNADTTYSRNRIRNSVLPEMIQVNAQAVAHMNRTAGQMQLVYDFLQQETKKALDKFVNIIEDVVEIQLGGLDELHPAVQSELIRESIFLATGERKDIASVHIMDVLSLLSKQSGKEIQLPYEIVAKKTFDTLRIARELEKEGNFFEKEVNAFELLTCKERNESLEILLDDGSCLQMSVKQYQKCEEEIPKKTYTKWFDYDKIKNGFSIRNRRDGDYFVQDAKGRHKKLSNYFIDEKIPAYQRARMPLLTRGSEVIWLIGGRISENYKVTSDTTDIVVIQYKGEQEYELQDET